MNNQVVHHVQPSGSGRYHVTNVNRLDNTRRSYDVTLGGACVRDHTKQQYSRIDVESSHRGSSAGPKSGSVILLSIFYRTATFLPLAALKLSSPTGFGVAPHAFWRVPQSCLTALLCRILSGLIRMRSVVRRRVFSSRGLI